MPHARAKLRKLRITNTQVVLGALLVTALFAGAGFVTWSAMTTRIDAHDVAELRLENESLREVNQTFETSIRELQLRLANYEDRTRKLAIVAGLGSFASLDEVGIGGEIVPRPPSDDLLALDVRSEALGGQLSAVENKLEERLRWISSVPSVTPVNGLFSSGFGFRRDPLTGRRAFHQGVDITAPPGTEVYATANGIVTRAGWVGQLGKAVHISHGFGLATRFGHLSEIAIEPGQKIRRGDLIGHVGSTGRSTGYHLHYEVRKDGRAVTPYAYILDRS